MFTQWKTLLWALSIMTDNSSAILYSYIFAQNPHRGSIAIVQSRKFHEVLRYAQNLLKEKAEIHKICMDVASGQ